MRQGAASLHEGRAVSFQKGVPDAAEAPLEVGKLTGSALLERSLLGVLPLVS